MRFLPAVFCPVPEKGVAFAPPAEYVNPGGEGGEYAVRFAGKDRHSAAGVVWKKRAGSAVAGKSRSLRVWVSEIILQQTRVEAVKPYFERFIAALPDLEHLAAAPEPLLMKLWEGLGYYSRVRNLQKAARMILTEFGGIFPSERRRCSGFPGSALTPPVRSHRSPSAARNRRWTAMWSGCWSG